MKGWLPSRTSKLQFKSLNIIYTNGHIEIKTRSRRRGCRRSVVRGLTWWKKKQVAQRATIAHPSPMYQGQVSFQKTYKWAMETRGPKSNSSKLLCLSWLPATLMMIRSKMNELAWRKHFPFFYKSMGKFLDAQGELTP